MGRAIEVRRVLLRTGEIVGDAWIHLEDDHPIPARGDVTLSLERLEADPTALEGRRDMVGVRVEGDADPARVAALLERVAMVVVRIAKFTDGRYFSLARLLRDRYDWQGGLRAVGDVLPDQVQYMQRCGFGSFEVRADKRIETARACLNAFTVTYQGAADDPRPLYRRRLASRSSAA